MSAQFPALRTPARTATSCPDSWCAPIVDPDFLSRAALPVALVDTIVPRFR